MTRPGWWAWHAAVRHHAPHAEALAVAMVWAGLCWDWRQGDLPDQRRARPVSADELADAFPYAMSQRALLRNLAELVEVGLLQRVRRASRSGPTTYAPADPDAAEHLPPVAPVDSERLPPVAPVDGQRLPPVAPVDSERLPPVAPTLFPSDVNPLPARTHAYVREESPDGRGDETSPGRDALEQLRRNMDTRWGHGTARQIAPGYQTQAARQLDTLLAAGWTSDELVTRINAREWTSAASVGRALLARLRDLAGEPAPKSIREANRAEAKAKAEAPPCDHGTPGGCSVCFMCRRGKPDEDGVLCRCTSVEPDGYSPAGYTPELSFPPTNFGPGDAGSVHERNAP